MAVSPSAIPVAEQKPSGSKSPGLAYPDAKGLWEQLRPEIEKRPDCANATIQTLQRFSETANEADFLTPFGPAQDADVKRAEECVKRAPFTKPGATPGAPEKPGIPSGYLIGGGIAVLGLIVVLALR